MSRSWTQLPGNMKQIDTGITSSLWAVNDKDVSFVFNNVSWVPVGGAFHYVTSGQAGVWAVSTDRHVFYRDGINHLNPTGIKWTQVGHASLRQIDSGPTGIVYGIDEDRKLVCRSGIKPGKPTGSLWKRIRGIYRHVTCGPRGCWAITAKNMIVFRFGVRADFCRGTLWIPVPSPVEMRYIEAGSDGSLWAVSEERGELWYRTGVDELHPYGQQWVKENSGDGSGYAAVTSGLNGEYILNESDEIFHLKSKSCLFDAELYSLFSFSNLHLSIITFHLCNECQCPISEILPKLGRCDGGIIKQLNFSVKKKPLTIDYVLHWLKVCERTVSTVLKPILSKTFHLLEGCRLRLRMQYVISCLRFIFNAKI